MKLFALGSIIILMFVGLAHAEMYRWVDENGIVTYKDTPPPATGKRDVKVYTNSDFVPDPPKTSTRRLQKQGVPPASAAGHSVAAEKKQAISGPIELYVTDWCSVCRRAEKYMTEKNYSFVTYDIEKDPAAMQRFKGLGGRGVPLIMLGSQKVFGFSASTVDRYMQGR
jgi:glutaredoxin